MAVAIRPWMALAGILAAGLPAGPGTARAELPDSDQAACQAGLPLPRPLPGYMPSKPPEPQPYERLSWQDPEVNLGIGHLLPAEQERFVPDWHRSIHLPFFAKPGSEHAGWMAGGWLVSFSKTGTTISAMSTRGMIETGDETPSFIVLAARDDGWLQFRLDVELGESSGTAWVHRCHLEAGETALRFESWGQRFVRDGETPPMFFRQLGRHSLRTGPGQTHDRAQWITGQPFTENNHLEPLEVEGDWMRVRVRQPSDYCSGSGSVRANVAEGWIKWRSADQGPWVWYPTRGC